ncbi:MAG: cyclic nucleotide-binding domain-containing protein [Candidatus Cloacimonetes bacterium]|jgi:CRP-like cAMP-binding protein|nr:cyclic nucleotide-binding domain-containing protein [Candidatus Cloacimonadota bacterium]MDD2719593.1 cyclic nucleotide-binding domain-containing protein [Candidatus Cloacimonadota bacterium]MDD3578168.1 cyclic nucleotide-binding domain-containing protein [Candidatus Cloacimonadota bacterium]MDD4791303.1 cyclic nucleotide-binding domain-containing protein [Candidatus Cloacimonadota bacterium]
MIALDTLRKIRVFGCLQDDELEVLGTFLEFNRFLKGEYLLKENSVGDCVYILVKGTVRVSKDLVKGFDEDIVNTQKVLATLNEQHLPTFGENGILGQAPRNANVIAATDCEVYSLSYRDFDNFAKDNPRAAYHIMKNIAEVLSQRLNSTDENLVKLATALYIAVQS